MTEQFTAQDALKIMIERAQACREDGDGDMRSIINTASYLSGMLRDGKTREEILADYYDDWKEDE